MDTHSPTLVDPDGLMEFSVVFTDRSLNHMSAAFQGVMRDISGMLKEVYKADEVAVVPGGGSYGMEAVARQFANGAHALIVRNGWFSYRWTQIFEAGGFASDTTVVMARQTGNTTRAPFAPPPINEVVAKIRETKPDAVFAPHVETSAGVRGADGARLYRLRLCLGGYESNRRRCADLRAAKGMVVYPIGGAGHDVRACCGKVGGDNSELLRGEPQDMAWHHESL